MIKFPSTPSLKDTIVLVKRAAGKPTFIGLTEDKQPIFEPVVIPLIKLHGTVKLHGTHADVRLINGEVVGQSRNRVLSLLDDHAGFTHFLKARENLFKSIFQATGLEMISGEWAGGNIQAGVAITGMPKTFFHFHREFGSFPESGVYSVYDFETFEVEADFNKPEELRNTLEALTLKVEEACPVGVALNPNRLNDIGEGIVWSFEVNGVQYKFKTKGEKHKRNEGIKVPRVAKVDHPAAHLIEPFLDEYVTVDRLEQGVEYLEEMGLALNQRSTGEYLKWVANDVLKEGTLDLDTLSQEHGLHWRDGICGGVQGRAKAYFFARLAEHF